MGAQHTAQSIYHTPHIMHHTAYITHHTAHSIYHTAHTIHSTHHAPHSTHHIAHSTHHTHHTPFTPPVFGLSISKVFVNFIEGEIRAKIDHFRYSSDIRVVLPDL